MSHTHSLRDEVATQLRNEILRGQYREGERLPSERDLAERFGVNRGCVREALKTLEQLGLADIRQGGARVMPLHDASLDIVGPLLELEELPDPELVLQIHEVVESLMSTAMRSAIQNGTEQHRERVRQLLEEIRAQSSQADYQQAVHELAELLVEASGNLVLRLIFRGLRFQFMGRLEAAGLNEPPPVDLFAPAATELLRAVELRDSDAAAATMLKLMRLRRESILKGLEEGRARTNGNGASRNAAGGLR